MSEDTLKKSFNVQYEMLLNAIPSSVLMIDRKLQVLSVNENFLVKSQRSKDNTVGRFLVEVFPLVILQSTGIEESIHNVFKSGVAVKGQKMTYRAPGVPLRIYYYSILPVPNEQIMLLMEDVTEQFRLSEEVRRVERHLASVVESASDIVLSTDIEGHILTWNSAAEKQSGLSAQDVYRQYFFDFCDIHQKQVVYQILQRMKTSNATHTTEFHLINPNSGATILISWVFSPMKDDYSKTIGTVVVGRDLAERRKLELQLRQSQKLTALGVMAGGIAHEIRNPLAVCSSAAQFLQAKQISKDFQKECAEKIQTNIQKASVIIENLLRFARSFLDTEMVEVDLISVLNETLELIANQAKVQKIKIKLSSHKKMILVLGVPGLLQQVFMNICLNAINAMPSGGLLSINVTTIEDRVIVRITDTGVGISPGELDKIFDPFHTSSPVGQGTGLGLSICYSIIRQHLGSIQAESRLGQGASLIVTLPFIEN
jgi:PAS domain S-box-containing protein